MVLHYVSTDRIWLSALMLQAIYFHQTTDCTIKYTTFTKSSTNGNSNFFHNQWFLTGKCSNNLFTKWPCALFNHFTKTIFRSISFVLCLNEKYNATHTLSLCLTWMSEVNFIKIWYDCLVFVTQYQPHYTYRDISGFGRW